MKYVLMLAVAITGCATTQTNPVEDATARYASCCGTYAKHYMVCQGSPKDDSNRATLVASAAEHACQDEYKAVLMGSHKAGGQLAQEWPEEARSVWCNYTAFHESIISCP